MSTTQKPTLNQYLDEELKKLGPDYSVAGFVDGLCGYSVGKTFAIQNLDTIDRIITTTDQDEAIRLVREIISNRPAILEGSAPTTTHDYTEQVRAQKMLENILPEVQSPGIVKDAQKELASELDNKNLIFHRNNEARVNNYYKDLRSEQRQKILNALAEETKNASAHEIRREFTQKIETNPAFINDPAAKQAALQIFEEDKLYEKIALRKNQSKAAVEGLVLNPHPFPGLSNKIITSAFSSDNPRKEVRKTLIETAASKQVSLNIPERDLPKAVQHIYEHASVVSKSSITSVLSTITNKEGSVVDAAGSKIFDSKTVHDIIKSNPGFSGGGFGNMISGFTSVGAGSQKNDDVAAYIHGASQSGGEASFQKFIASIAFADDPGAFKPSGGSLVFDLAMSNMKRNAVSSIASAGAKEVLISIFSKILAGSNPVAFAASVAGKAASSLSSIAMYGGSSWVSNFARGIVGAITNGNAVKQKNDGVLLLLVGMVAVIPLIGTLGKDITDTSAFVPIAVGGEGINDGPIIDCNTEEGQSNPVCTYTPCVGECRWPTSGVITQGPAAACGSHGAGEDANGVDIAKPGLSVEVYSVVNGKVLSIFNSCQDYKGNTTEDDVNRDCGGGYGNHIRIEGIASNGGTYTLIYGHLQSSFPKGIVAGADIKIGDPLGKMDNSGYTSGQHLHFGVLSGGNVLDLLPDNDPFPINSLQGCNNSCGKACPKESVSPS